MIIIEKTIGWLAPPFCVGCGVEGKSLCEACATSDILPFGSRCFKCSRLSPRSRTCAACRRAGSPRYVWITTSHEGLARQLIQRYKFGHQRQASLPIAVLMAETIRANLSDIDMAKLNYLLVPVPTASSRVRARSFDHSKLLAKTLGGLMGCHYESVLLRHGQNRQVGSGKTTRIAQAKQNYSLKTHSAVKGRNILLIDDVTTTGATLDAIAALLRRAGARRVDAVVFAKRI